ncbi:hypothetical protein BC629DRAFT_1592794 [Irpex lacteus]|nr:hypothetical protein BC629DRAFT_1592794 [Irpex lacteus]
MVPQTLVITQTWVPITTSWRIVCVAAREFHEEKVKDTKVELDNLPVFLAGPFSAVLSAFLVESYQRLLPNYGITNPSFFAKSLVVTRQISLQIANPEYRPMAACASRLKKLGIELKVCNSLPPERG